VLIAGWGAAVLLTVVTSAVSLVFASARLRRLEV
jgi:hypothetical protein